MNAKRNQQRYAIVRASGLAAILLAQPLPAGAQQTLEPVEVTGHYDNSVGSTNAASAGVITPGLIEDRPLLRPGSLLEYVPGLVVTQHSGVGKANQYFLRGFNLDHGTDFATWVAGMPVNLRTHAHGQGYTDLNFVIPELVSGVRYFKGPYHAGSATSDRRARHSRPMRRGSPSARRRHARRTRLRACAADRIERRRIRHGHLRTRVPAQRRAVGRAERLP